MKFDLQKQTDKAKFTIEKKGIPTSQKMAVVLNLDVSGSAQGLYTSGTIQELFESITPLALNFDDNQSLQVFTFSSGSSSVSEITPDANASNYAGYIKKNILENRNVPKWGGTEYAPVLKANLENLGYYKKSGLFGGKQLQAKNDSGYPSFIITFTDGANQDQYEVRRLLREYQDKGVNAYFLYIGVGPSSYFTNIEELGEEFSNVGFVGVSNIQKFVDSDDIYDQLLPDELIEWLKAARN